MLWEPRTDAERDTYRFIQRLEEYVRDPKRYPYLFAVGSIEWPSFSGESSDRAPIVAIDADFGPRPPLRFLPEPGPTLTNHRLRNMLVPINRADPDVRRLLAPLDLPDSAFVLFIPPPRPARPIGRRVWIGPRHASMGFVLVGDGRAVPLTAGHAVEAAPCAALYERRRWLFPAYERLGSVQHSSDPKGYEGVDVAVIEPAQKWIAHDFQPLSLAGQSGGPPRVRAPCRLYGAASGQRTGWLLNDFATVRSEDGRIWRDCWCVMETEGGFAKPGDSGGIVMVGNEALGMLVAAMGVVRSSGRYQVGLVQDAQTLLTYIKTLPDYSDFDLARYEPYSPRPDPR